MSLSTRMRWLGAMAVTAQALSLSSGLGLSTVQAAEKIDMETYSQLKFSINQAIAAAEKEAGGKAIEAELEKDSGAWIYEVKVLSKGKTTEMKIDANTGKVVSAKSEQHEPRAASRSENGSRSGLGSNDMSGARSSSGDMSGVTEGSS